MHHIHLPFQITKTSSPNLQEFLQILYKMATETVRNFVEKPDEDALHKQEEGVEVAAQWAHEKIENFLLELE